MYSAMKDNSGHPRPFKKPVQLGLFWEAIRYAHLVAVAHCRPVYYDIWLEGLPEGRYRVRKESGIVGRKPDIRAWEFDSHPEAEKEFDRRIRSKTNPNRKAPRIYQQAG